MTIAHFTLGFAVITTLCRTNDLKELIILGLVGGLSSILPDLGFYKKKINRMSNKVIKIVIPLLAFTILVKCENINIYDFNKLIKFFIGTGVLSMFTIIHKLKLYRNLFQHLIYCCILWFILMLIIPEFSKEVMLGLISNIVLTLFFYVYKNYDLGIKLTSKEVNKLVSICSTICIIINLITIW